MNRHAVARNSRMPHAAGMTWTGLACWAMSLASVDLKPDALKKFILANREALLAEAAAGLVHHWLPQRR